MLSIDGIRNEAFRIWRKYSRTRYTHARTHFAHTVHPHNAPFADVEAQKMIAAAGAPKSLDLKYYDECVKKTANALEAAVPRAVQFTHIGIGSAEVKEVASNRRVLGPDGKVKFTRSSATKNKEARDEPEGLIDPKLRTLSFWDGEKPLAALHFYACHPMSYYGDGRVSADFCGPRGRSGKTKPESSRPTSTAAAETSPPESTTMARRRTAPSCAIACTPQ